MFKKILRVLGEGAINSVEGVIQDFVWGKKARKGRYGAFKPAKAPRVAKRRAAARMQPTVVYVYANHAHFN